MTFNAIRKLIRKNEKECNIILRHDGGFEPWSDDDTDVCLVGAVIAGRFHEIEVTMTLEEGEYTLFQKIVGCTKAQAKAAESGFERWNVKRKRSPSNVLFFGFGTTMRRYADRRDAKRNNNEK